MDCIDSNFVSSVGARVTEFEERVAAFTGAGCAVATVNGTAALHVALQLAGVTAETEVITQALTFVATCNAVRYAGAWPVFVDVDRDTLSLSPAALAAFLDQFGRQRHLVSRRAGAERRRNGGGGLNPAFDPPNPRDAAQSLAERRAAGFPGGAGGLPGRHQRPGGDDPAHLATDAPLAHVPALPA